MKGKRYSTEDKVRTLREVDAGKSIVDVCRDTRIAGDDINVVMVKWISADVSKPIH